MPPISAAATRRGVYLANTPSTNSSSSNSDSPSPFTSSSASSTTSSPYLPLSTAPSSYTPPLMTATIPKRSTMAAQLAPSSNGIDHLHGVSKGGRKRLPPAPSLNELLGLADESRALDTLGGIYGLDISGPSRTQSKSATNAMRFLRELKSTDPGMLVRNEKLLLATTLEEDFRGRQLFPRKSISSHSRMPHNHSSQSSSRTTTRINHNHPQNPAEQHGLPASFAELAASPYSTTSTASLSTTLSDVATPSSSPSMPLSNPYETYHHHHHHSSQHFQHPAEPPIQTPQPQYAFAPAQHAHHPQIPSHPIKPLPESFVGEDTFEWSSYGTHEQWDLAGPRGPGAGMDGSSLGAGMEGDGNETFPMPDLDFDVGFYPSSFVAESPLAYMAHHNMNGHTPHAAPMNNSHSNSCAGNTSSSNTFTPVLGPSSNTNSPGDFSFGFDRLHPFQSPIDREQRHTQIQPQSAPLLPPPALPFHHPRPSHPSSSASFIHDDFSILPDSRSLSNSPVTPIARTLPSGPVPPTTHDKSHNGHAIPARPANRKAPAPKVIEIPSGGMNLNGRAAPPSGTGASGGSAAASGVATRGRRGR
ncbi:hypothetical protein DL93DRAFT_375183 [Clavulina sp. PMI_390]|nr:hypothetical protein DL93DRAFT_375183 [Clavulina sp. PMI_390]